MKNKRKAWNKINWTNDELGFLIVYNDRYTTVEMSKILGKSVRTIKRKCYDELNLFKTDEAIYNHRSNADKRRGTDLSYEYVKNEALKYNTKIEFYQKSPNAYGKANLMNWDDVFSHMVSKMFSLPQLILKSFLEQIFDEKCSYNDRKAINPYEIDCYFPKYKIGWEYNGARFHQNNKNDKIKSKIAKEKGIKLFYIVEEKSTKKYESFIKSVLKKQINEINMILPTKKIDEDYINGLKSVIDYPNLLTKKEANLVKGKKINEIKNIDYNLYNRIIRYNLFDKYYVKDDRRKMHKFKTFDEYFTYIKNKNYSSFQEAYTKQHIHRMCKKFGKDLKEIKKIYDEKK